MKLDVTLALRTPGVTYPFEAEQAIAPQEVLGDTVTFDPARLEGELMATEGGNILIRGRLAATAHSRCANCLAPASVPLEAEFDEVFCLDGDPEDDDIFVYGGSRVELERLARTYALLALPMRILCRAGCRRRPDDSPVLGADSVAEARSASQPVQRPFEGLGQLLSDRHSDAED